MQLAGARQVAAIDDHHRGPNRKVVIRRELGDAHPARGRLTPVGPVPCPARSESSSTPSSVPNPSLANRLGRLCEIFRHCRNKSDVDYLILSDVGAQLDWDIKVAFPV
jgi:hypothetical protein